MKETSRLSSSSKKKKTRKKDYFFPKAYRVTEYYYSQATQNKTKPYDRGFARNRTTPFIAVSLTVHSLLALRMRGEENKG
jgi:hypothetical protein